MDIRETDFLHDYNKETYEKIKDIFKTENSCAVVQPTGTGKSYIMMKTMYDFKDKWKIVIAPSRDFLNNLETNKYWTSDKTVTLTYSFIGRNYDNLEQALADYRINKDNVGLIILDELHRAGAPKWGIGVKNLMTMCKDAKTLGLTATPKRYDEGRDMVEELFDNRLAQNMNLGKAIDLEIIPQLSYVVGMHDLRENLDEIVKNIKDSDCKAYITKKADSYKEKWDFNKYFIDTLSKYIDINQKSGKHIIFASSIDEADRISLVAKKWFSEMFKNSQVCVYTIHSKSSTKSFDLEQFFADNKDNEIKVAVAVNMLNESFHCNDIRSISMFRGTQSIQVYMQQIGRALTAHGESPYIFDFVDNFHAIKELQEVLSRDNIERTECDVDSTTFVFKEFNDETKWFIKDINNIKQLTSIDSRAALLEIEERLKESSDGTIFGVDDKDFVNWATYILRTKAGNMLRMSFDDESIRLYEKLGFSIDVAENLGKEWYHTFKDYINDKYSISDDKLKYFRATYNKAVILNVLQPETKKFFEEHGLVTKITANEDKLLSMLSKHKPKSLRYYTKIENYRQLMETGTDFEKYKESLCIENMLSESVERSWNYSMLGDACCYWLYEIYKDKYAEEIKTLKNKFDKLSYLDEYLYRDKRNKILPSIDTVNKVDMLIKDYEKVVDLDSDIQDMLKYYKVRTINGMYSTMFMFLGFNTIETDIDTKIKHIITSGNCTNENREFLIKHYNKIDETLKLDKFSWSNRVMAKRDELKNKLESAIAYIDGKDKTEKTAWFWDYAADIKDQYLFSKSKKHIAVDGGFADIKLNNMYDTLNSCEAFLNQLSEKYKQRFIEQYNIAEEEWNNKYGNEYSYELKAMPIGMIALSRLSKELSIEKVSCISIKLGKQISMFFNWLYVAEKQTLEYTPIKIKLIEKASSIMKENIAYLAILGMSKKIRGSYLNVYEHYLKTEHVIDEECISIMTECSDNDIQMMHNIEKLETIRKYTKLNEMHERTVLAYDLHIEKN